MHPSEPEYGYRIVTRLIARRITGANLTSHNGKDKARGSKKDAKKGVSND